MMKRKRVLSSLLWLLLASSGSSIALAQEPPPADAGQQQAAPEPPAAPTDDLSDEALHEDLSFSALMEAFEYNPRGRRDPFVQPIPDKPVEQGSVHGPLLPLQKFDLSQLRLVGIIWDVRKPQAMIKDPSGSTHLVGTNTRIGPRNGYIAVIREGEIVVVETQEQEGRLVSTAQVVKIAR